MNNSKVKSCKVLAHLNPMMTFPESSLVLYSFTWRMQIVLLNTGVVLLLLSRLSLSMETEP